MKIYLDVAVLQTLRSSFLEFWNSGILEFWNSGILEYWNTGNLLSSPLMSPGRPERQQKFAGSIQNQNNVDPIPRQKGADLANSSGQNK